MKTGFKGFVRRPPPSDEMTLQITSMADIFTIILVFLLKSYATSAVNVTPSKGMQLPQALQSEVAPEALKVEISETGVQVEGKPVLALQKFMVDARDLEANNTLKPLNSALDLERKRQLQIAAANSSVKIDPKILVIADQRVPYVTIKAVLASAAINGYTDFKLAVVKGD